ncbi:Solute carrier family 22 member 6 [Holothuria leucospilota]|uniref:Solute carrier family 22 member 6 n=1 Tax=Holothuria leucospilota TaxID=206669 RepID=A0A9Q0YGY4_HOLLE|nr:Solute carrier family 22 member 6 [Holothuria leucospilota]
MVRKERSNIWHYDARRHMLLCHPFNTSSGIGLFSTSSRIGGILAPLILILEEVWPSLPVLIFGSFSIAAGCLCLLLPETKGKPLPSTTRETKSLYRKIDSHESKGEKGGTNDDEKKYAPL